MHLPRLRAAFQHPGALATRVRGWLASGDERVCRILAPARPSLAAPWRYGLAVLLAVAATALRWALHPWLGPVVPYSVALLAVVVSGAWLGMGPGLVTLLLAEVAVEVFIVAPSGIHTGVLPRFVMYAAIGLLVCYLLHALREARRAADSEAALTLVEVGERRHAEAALRESEQRVRLKLDSILAPAGDIGALELADLIDVPAMQELMDRFYALARIPMSLIDLKGRVLVGVGWQDVCLQFHRAHAETRAHCHESDTRLTAGVAPGEFRLYRCQNQMWDAATPILIGTRQVGNIFTGQFFFTDTEPDYAAFREQARRYGFDEAHYLAALDRVPRLTREAVKAGMEFFLRLAQTISKLGYANVALARALQERASLADSLREADRRKDEFLGMLSHELRNPLTPIRNSLFVLGRVAPGGEQAVRAEAVIERQVGHLTRLVDDLLDVTRISRGKIRLQPAACELVELVRRTIDDHRAAFEANGLALEARVESGPLWLEADATRLAQVVDNLLGNAAKFTPRGGRVTVALGRVGEAAVVSVCDNGVGIAPEVLGELFQPFTQAPQSLDRSRGGLGLGLALVKGLVELHGGTVTAQSDGPGHGAAFTIRLPLAAAPAAPPPEERRAGRRRRVVVIEDSRDAAHSLREALELMGHEVQVAYDGPSGLGLARAFRPEVVLCDIGLPAMDGYEVARAARADGALRRTFLVALTGYAMPEDVARAKAAGFDAHLAKPPSLERLTKLLAE